MLKLKLKIKYFHNYSSEQADNLYSTKNRYKRKNQCWNMKKIADKIQ